MKTETFIHGVYSRSEELVTATRGFDRGRVTAQQVQAAEQQDYKELTSLQESEGLSFIEDGKGTWQDIFRPFGQTTAGLSFDGGVTRWFDNNTFFRRPVITGKLVPDLSALDAFFPAIDDKSKWKVTLPSPLTFARLSQDTTTSHPHQTLENVTELIKTTIDHLEDRGVSFVQLNEPCLPYIGANADEIDDLVASLHLLGHDSRKAHRAIHFYFGDATDIVRRLEDEHVVDTIGVDFLKTPLDRLPRRLTHGLIAGVLDGRNSLVESPSDIEQTITTIANHTQPTTLYISHNTDLEFLPESVARQKVHTLGGLKNI